MALDSTSSSAPLAAQLPPVPVSSLSRMVPQVKQTTNTILKQQAEFERTAFCRSIDIMAAYPKLRESCRNYLEGLLLEHVKAEKFGSEVGQEVSTLSKFREDWCAAFVSGQLSVSMSALGIAKAADPRVVKNIMQGLLNASPSCQVPMECCSDGVMEQCCKDRIEKAGHREKLFMDPIKLISPEGAVDWKAGVYAVEFEEASDKAKFLIHRPTNCKVDIPQALLVDTSWVIQFNWDDMLATLYKTKLQQQKCLNFFEKDQGPNSLKQWKGKAEEFQKEATLISQRLKAQSEGTKKSAQDLAEYHTPTKSIQKERTKRAREALEVRKRDTDKHRRASWKQLADAS